jgi:hypothetical protein
MAVVEASILGVVLSTLAVVVSRAALVTKVADIREEEGFRGAMASKVAGTRRRAAGRGPVGEATMLIKVHRILLLWGVVPTLWKARVATWGPRTMTINANLGRQIIRGTMVMSLETMEVLVHISSDGRVTVHITTVLVIILLTCNHGRVLTLIYFSRRCKLLSPRSRQQQRSLNQLREFLRRMLWLEELGSLRLHLL